MDTPFVFRSLFKTRKPEKCFINNLNFLLFTFRNPRVHVAFEQQLFEDGIPFVQSDMCTCDLDIIFSSDKFSFALKSGNEKRRGMNKRHSPPFLIPNKPLKSKIGAELSTDVGT